MSREQLQALADSIAAALARFRFKAADPATLPADLDVVAAWTRKRFTCNVAVAALAVPPQVDDVGLFARRIMKPVGRALGYKTFWNPQGLQLVLCGEDLAAKAAHVEACLDSVGTLGVQLQSIHVVDPVQRRSRSARSPARLGSGRYIRAIEQGIADFLAAG
jgi:hypothetical protein